MSKKWRGVLVVLAVLLALVLVTRFILPYGIMPKWSSPNCGPEHWRWLGRSFQSRGEVAVYLQEHARELLSGSLAPLPDGSVDWIVPPSDDVLFGQFSVENIQVERRSGYVIYSLTFHRPACNPGQSYTFKVTSFGLASLYGCCGI
jgi:hypothetical protein